jgi:hypothetical protein
MIRTPFLSFYDGRGVKIPQGEVVARGVRERKEHLGQFGKEMSFSPSSEKGKPIERWGHKAEGSRSTGTAGLPELENKKIRRMR